LVPTGGTVTPPAAPTNLTASAGNAQVTLSWTASTGASSYNVYRGTTAGGEGATPIQTNVTNLSYPDTAVTNGTTYYYVVTAVNAGGESSKSNEASATPSTGGTSTVRVNSGGPTYTTQDGRLFTADTFFTSGSTTNRGNISISATSDPALYQTLRYAPTFGYSIPAANGTYTLNLYFAETGGYGAGQRLFNVSVNGTVVLSKLDVYSQAGGANKAIIKSIPVTVSNGTLAISFSAVSTGVNSFVNAVELIPSP